MLSSLIKQVFRKNSNQNSYYDHEKLVKAITQKANFLQQNNYLEWPAIVHMETAAVCNAACSFCTYPTLERKGVKMSDALIEKIINDLTAIPKDVVFQLAPYKVSDPFLEVRLFDIIKLANEKLPGASISLITNGSPLTEKKIDQLSAIKNLSYMNISLNYNDEEEYESVMKINFTRTIEKLVLLHAKKKDGLPFPIRLTRVSDNKTTDMIFIDWVMEKFPLFVPAIIPRNDWIGDIKSDQQTLVPDAPCHRWFDLSITSTGIVAMCCMDGEAKYPKGDVNKQHALDIYNQPHLKRLRETLISRKEAMAPCNGCTYLSY
jgi:hypothetical protein